MVKRALRRPRKSRRGLTLVEVVIGTLIAVFLTSAAVVFANHETKLLGFSTEQVEMQQSARTSLDLLARDIELAGAGLGYLNCTPATCVPASTGPRFAGLQTARFTALGPAGTPGLAFNDTPFGMTPLNLAGAQLGSNAVAAAYGFPTHDLGILMADEQRVTVAMHDSAAGVGQICDANDTLPLNVPLFAVMRDETLISGLATRIQVVSNAALGNCSLGACAPNIAGGGAGCRQVQFLDDPWNVYITDAAAPTLSFSGGEAAFGFKQVIWWVQNDPVPQDSHRANLRRAELGYNSQTGAEQTCAPGAANRAVCGGEVAYNVETLHYQVWRFLPENPVGGTPGQDLRWQVVPAGPIDPPAGTDIKSRLRVDVEIVVRARVGDERQHQGVRVTIPQRCMPGNTAMPAAAGTPCAQRDNVQRRVHRISVDVKNSGK